MFKRFRWVFLLTAAVGAIGGFLVAAVVAYVTPRKYESSATIEIRPQITKIGSTKNGRMDVSSLKIPMTREFFLTEFERVKSGDALGKVVGNLDLVVKWDVATEVAVQILKGIVTIENIRGTDLISIQVRHTNKEDARDITAEIARNYKTYWRELESRNLDREFFEWSQQFTDEEEKVERKRQALTEVDREMRKNVQVEDSAGLLQIHESKEYIDAKRELESAEQVFLTMRLNALGTTGCILDDGPVVIHEEPQIAHSPVSPNVPLILTFGSAGGILLSPLLALPVMLLLNRANPQRVDGPPALP